jgi:hypothetical protein
MAMPPFPQTPELLEVATRVIWFEPPEVALADPVRFLAYVMTYATLDDINIVRRYATPADFTFALDHAPPGLFDPRSWAYWNVLADRYPPPPMPKRFIG